MNRTSFSTLVAAAFLAGCALYAAFDHAAAGSLQVSIEPHGRAYLFRGFGGMIFSRGMDRLTEQIEHAGITASVAEAAFCPVIAEEAIHDYRRNPAPISVIGHSVGAACALKFAEMLAPENIPVSLVVTMDPARITAGVPLNVERYINIFQSTSILGGRDVAAPPAFQGHYASFDLAEHEEITHFNIEKEEAIHEQLVTKILQLAATPTKVEGGTVPIRYVVPADAAIELWDSGKPVFALAGDTLQTLAMTYHVPLWSLVQMNPVAETAPLAPGQRIVVPRHLIPLVSPDADAVSGEGPSKQ